MPFLIAGLVAVFLLLLVAFIRALLFNPPKRSEISNSHIEVDVNRAANELSELIKCKTVSSVNPELEDMREFHKLEKTLKRLFPKFHREAGFEKVGERAILYRWHGESSENPTVLMAHYDVVSANEDEWTRSAFGGEIADGFVYGRGAIDTKVTLSSMLHAAEMLIGEGFRPKSDIYFSFGSDEEVGGRRGASDVVSLLESRGIRPSLVLDEGGAVVKNVFPGVRLSTAIIGISEKGMVNISYTAKSNGGHASTPKPDTPIARLARVISRINKRPFGFRITKPTALMLDRLARHSSFGYRFIFANLWLFSPLLDIITKKSGGELSAIFRTTTCFTELYGSEGMNVIPTKAVAISNHRILPGETPESVRARLERLAAADGVSVDIISAQAPSRICPVDCAEYKKIEKTVEKVWQNSIVSPYLMVACSDSRHFDRICDRVYRFSPIEFIGDERFSMHAHDERISLQSLEKCVKFFYLFIKQS